MTDYGHDLLFGTFLTPDASDPRRVVALAELSDAAGLDLVTVQDHPYQPRFLDAWTLLSVIAAVTQRVRVAPNVANLPLRQPAVLARSAASLDLLSGGRVELGLGAGAFWDPIVAMGGPRLGPGEAVTALEEAIDILRGLWSAGGAGVRVDGRHHRVTGARPGPVPTHDIGIWLGAYKPRMLALTGRRADGWLPSQSYAAPEALPALNAAIDEAAAQAGRSPREIRRLYNVTGRFTASREGFLAGPVGSWVDDLAGLVLTDGMSAFVLAGDDPEVIRRFAADVAPAVRDRVGRERAPQPATNPAQHRERITADGPASDAPRRAGAVAARSGPPAGLGVRVTPDDGRRLSGERVWDETARPSGPAPDPARTYTAQQRAAGRQLVDIHDHLRAELDQIRRLVEQVLDGALEPGIARSSVNAMTMRQNDWTLGAYCAAYCRVVTTHHTIEDQHMFPALRHGDPRLAPVIDRLEQEHLTIHEVLERVDGALVCYVRDSDAGAALQDALDVLTDALLSHLSYEEHELVEPLSRLDLLV